MWVAVAIGAVVLSAASGCVVWLRRRQPWLPLFAQLQRIGLRPMGRRRVWEGRAPDGLLLSVNTQTREFAAEPAANAKKERLPEVRSRRGAWEPRGSQPENLSGDPTLDEVAALQCDPRLAHTLPVAARRGLRRLVLGPAVQLAKGATRWRWEGAWPPDEVDAERFGEAMEGLIAWAAAAQDPKPVEFRLLRGSREEPLLWLRQLCVLALEADFPAIAKTAPERSSPATVTAALNELWRLDDDDAPDHWRHEVAETVVLGVPSEVRGATMKHAVVHGALETAAYLLGRLARDSGDKLAPAQEQFAGAALWHSHPGVRGQAVRILAERGSEIGAKALESAGHSGVFKTDEERRKAAEALKRIRTP